LLAKLDQLAAAFPRFPLLVGTSRKSFLGRLLADSEGNPAPVEERLHGSMASLTAAILQGAHLVRVHDVNAARDSVLVATAIKLAKG
jgi:dihydropteroate synthase